MSAASGILNGLGKRQADRSGDKNLQPGKTNERVISKIKEMYELPAVILGRWLGISDKATKRKLNCQRSLSIEELGELIRSERGFEIVTAVMGEARPEWWRICSVLMEAADIKKMQIAAQRRAAKVLRGVLDADRDLSAAIERAETLAFYGSEQAGVHADALRSLGGLPNSTVAPTKERGVK